MECGLFQGMHQEDVSRKLQSDLLLYQQEHSHANNEVRICHIFT